MSLSPTDLLLARSELSDLVCNLNRHYELHEYAAMAALYTEDAHYANWRGDVVGRAAILRLMQDRAPDRLVRHVLSNIVIDVESATRARGLCYVTAFLNPHGHPATRAVQQDGPPAIAEYHFRFRRVDGRWLVAEKRTMEIFAPQFLASGGPNH